MQLIKNDQEREQAGLPHLIFCGACDEELCSHYLAIILSDRNRTGYHLACAAHLVSDISDALADYLAEQSEGDAMAAAFRKALRDSGVSQSR